MCFEMWLLIGGKQVIQFLDVEGTFVRREIFQSTAQKQIFVSELIHVLISGNVV